MKKYDVDMTSGNLLKKLILYSIPLIITGVLQLLYNACDLIVVERFAGKEPFAAVGATGSLINLIVNIFMGLSIGSSVAYAKSVGAKDYARANRVVHTSVFVSLICGLILTVVGVLGARTFLVWMDCPEDVLDLATLYVRIYFAGIIGNLLYNFAASVVRANGDTKRPLYILGIAGLINVLLNLLFVIVFDMSVAGVALATIISQALSAGAIMYILFKEDGPLHFSIKEMKIDRDAFLEMIKYGLPSGIQGSLFSVSNVIIQSSINSFGTTVVAGNTAMSNLEGFVYAGMIAIYQSCMNFVSQNYGAKKYQNMKKILLYSLLCVIIIGEGLGIPIYLLGNYILRIYSRDPEVIQYAMIRAKYLCLIYALCGTMDVMVGAIRGMGYSLMPMIVSLIGACGLRIVWIFAVFNNHRSLDILYASYPISWAVTISIHVVCYFVVLPKVKGRMEDAPTEMISETVDEVEPHTR